MRTSLTDTHGRTLPFDRPMSFANMATDIARIGWLGHEQADLMGYSLGGMTALRTAIDHPEVVDKLILVSTPKRRRPGSVESKSRS